MMHLLSLFSSPWSNVSQLILLFGIYTVVIVNCTESDLAEREYGVKYASTCEVCKFLSIELESRFKELGQTHQVIETGYSLDAAPRKRVKYDRSELYLIEALEGACDKLLEYNVHKERTDSNRFAKGISTTFKTLHELVDKGVKVDLGIPYDLWDSPSAEVTALKSQCEDSLEKYNDAIETWYWGDRKQPLQQYLCRDRMLKKDQLGCLDDPPPPPPVDYKPKRRLDESGNPVIDESGDDSDTSDTATTTGSNDNEERDEL